jgi:hypothetical protein
MAYNIVEHFHRLLVTRTVPQKNATAQTPSKKDKKSLSTFESEIQRSARELAGT